MIHLFDKYPCGTTPERKKRRQLLKRSTKLPNWSVDQVAEYVKANPWSREEWFPIDQFQKNQGRRGSCNYYAMTAVIERLIKQNFLYHIKLSPELGYANNVDGNDRGSVLTRSLRDGMEVGAPPYLQRHFEKIRRRDFTQADFENALRFRGLEFEPVDTYLELLIGVAIGFPGVVAIHAGSNYMKQKRNGWAGVDNGRGNHAVAVDKVRIGSDGRIGLEQPGSWGVNVHDDGIAHIHEGHFKQTNRYHKFWIGTGIRLDPKIELDFKTKIAA